MKGNIEFYCRQCKCATEMILVERINNSRFYKLRCKCCNNTWRVPVDVLKEEYEYI